MNDPALLEKLRDVPTAVLAPQLLKIVNKDGDVVPLDPRGRPGQQKFAALVQQMEEADQPVRIILVKSRQWGGSTWIQGELQKRAITRPRRNILVVAQDMDTSGYLFGMGQLMHEHLPDALRPPIATFNNPARGTKVVVYGEKVGPTIQGLNSRIQIDTAAEVAGGRGRRYSDLHLSECAHWPDSLKALSLLPAVPKRPGTSIFLESTANGLNWFHSRFKEAMQGNGSFEALFVGWWEDPDCYRPFPTVEARAEFVASIGDVKASPYAEEEPWLVEEFGCTPEQLHFRRTAVVDECEGKVELFKQEYPATWTEAFIGSGRQVFSVVFTQRALREAEWWQTQPPELGGPQRGLFVGEQVEERRLLDGTIRVPRAAKWVPEPELAGRVEWWPGQFWDPKDPLWTLWLPAERSPEEWRRAYESGDVTLEQMESGMARALLGPGQYVLAGDPADDIENNSPSERNEHAFNALIGIDHRTGAQVAEFQARLDHDLVARHAFLCGLFLNEAWLSIERTGGYGTAMLNLLHKSFYYRRMYTEKALDTKKQQETTRHGWSTDRGSKPQMEATAQAMLREESHGIRSPGLALELTTYVKDEKNHRKHEPSPGSFSDRLMAWMQAQEIRRLKPLRPWLPDDAAPMTSITRRFGG